MKTPIYNFVNEYADCNKIRMHMPGHKGSGNIEKYDITEIAGADSLYEADGIIRQSENNASQLFCADTFYSAEGSSLAIRAMLMLIDKHAKALGKRCSVLASRNAHKTFVSAAALIGFELDWIYAGECTSYLSSDIAPYDVERAILNLPEPPTAVYITSPDYLGKMLDIKGISEVCKKYGVILAVDNAHGAYLKFLKNSLHPIDLGAVICCDSAHKTLPCLTGGAYLHISRDAPEIFSKNAKDAMALFGSTSPSYLILSSLDRANEYLASSFTHDLVHLIGKLDALKENLRELGYSLYGDEQMKITLKAKEYGYYGTELSAELEKAGISVEFADRDFVTLMPSVMTSDDELLALKNAFGSIKRRDRIDEPTPRSVKARRVLSVREAIFSDSEAVNIDDAVGRVLADVTVGCPPAVPIIVSGEEVSEDAVSAFKYYGIDKIKVVKDGI